MRVINKILIYTALAATTAWAGDFTSPAKANTYDVTFTGSNFDLSAVITTSNTLDALGGYDIMAIAGSVTGLTSGTTSGSITGLISNPGQPYQGTYYAGSYGWNYDNVLFPTSVPFDNNGVLFSFGTDIIANLYSVGSLFYLSVDNPTSLFDPGDLGTLSVSDPPATPLPATLPLFATGLAAMGLLGWYRKRKPQAALAS